MKKRGMNKRVMLVEDNQMSARLLEFVLNRDGYIVSIMASATEALDSAKDDPPDIIIMDIQLPDMDGLEATRQLKNNPVTAKIPVVAITAYAMTGDEERTRAAGCAGYVSKPVNTRELAETIGNFLSA
jgi:CheY-like chemotaxis protein